MFQNLSIRETDGISVSLDFDSTSRELTVSVRTESDDFTLREVPHPLALDVFNHPYAYAERLLVAGTFASVAS